MTKSATTYRVTFSIGEDWDDCEEGILTIEYALQQARDGVSTERCALIEQLDTTPLYNVTAAKKISVKEI